MKTVIQRVNSARVEVDSQVVGQIGIGLLVFIGIGKEDTTLDADYLVDKLMGLRIFPDENGKMNRSVQDAGGSVLLVSQFTLYGDCRRGRRPSFDQAAPPQVAQSLYNHFIELARRYPVPVEVGIFQAAMDVHLINQGPVTILMDSADRNK
jgi:D-tyrosyl-tRNA(Tyr) deacylase